jgi:hypothetical protein
VTLPARFDVRDCAGVIHQGAQVESVHGSSGVVVSVGREYVTVQCDPSHELALVPVERFEAGDWR